MKKLKLPLVLRPRAMHLNAGESKPIFVEDTIVAHENGGEIIRTALHIEKACTDLIAAYFFPTDDPLKEQFEGYILETSWCSFESKRKLFFMACDALQLWRDDERRRLEEAFSKVLRYRNAFAHGFIYQNGEKLFVAYFTGGKQCDLLDDQFWDTLERNIRFTFDLVHAMTRRLRELRKSKNA